MKRLIILLFTASLLSAEAFAQQVTDSELGIEFTPPEGWQATKKEIGYVMGSSDTQGFMLLKTAEFKNVKGLKSAMEGGIEQADGSILKPSGELGMLGKLGVSGMYQGAIEEVEMTGFMMALMPDGKGKAAIVIAVAPTKVFNQSNMDQLKLLLRSVMFK